MRKIKLITFALAIMVIISIQLAVHLSFADEKMPTADDFEIMPLGEIPPWEIRLFYGIMSIGDSYVDFSGNKLFTLPNALLGSFTFTITKEYAVIKKGGKSALINREGNLLVDFEYDEIVPLKDDDEFVFRAGNGEDENYREGVLNKDFKLTIPLEYARYEMEYKGEGIFCVKKNGKVILLDGRTGKRFDDEFDQITGEYEYGLLRVYKNKKYGYIDRTGKFVIPLIYDYADDFSDGVARVETDYEKFVIDTTGKILFSHNYNGIHQFYNGIARVTNMMESFSIPYQNIDSYTYSYIDKTGKVILEVNDSNLNPDPLYDGRSLIEVENRKTSERFFMDLKGNEIHAKNCEFIARDRFYDGLIKVKVGNNSDKRPLYGYADTKGDLVIPGPFWEATGFRNGVAWVNVRKNEGDDNEYHLIDKTGRSILPIVFSDFGWMDPLYETLYWYGSGDPFEKGATMVNKGLDRYIISDKRKRAYYNHDMDFDEYRKEHFTEDIKLEDKNDPLVLPMEELEGIRDKAAAISAVERAISDATIKQKSTADNIDILTLYGEEAALRVAGTEVQGSNIIIDENSIIGFQSKSLDAKNSIGDYIRKRGIRFQRELYSGVLYKVKDSDRFSVIVNGLTSNVKVDKIKVESPNYALTIGKNVLTSSKDFNITVDGVQANVVDVSFGNDQKEYITLSLPPVQSDPRYQTVFDSNGKVIGGKYNPVTKKIDVKINKSGKYIVKENKKSFSDIGSKSEEMREAIEVLASKGIITGTGADKFNPDGTITRAEIAALILRAISKLNPSEDGGFSDVTSADWYFGAVGSAKKHGIMKGVSDTLFAPKNTILKDQIVAVASRVLVEEMKYSYSRYPGYIVAFYNDADSIRSWFLSDVALAVTTGIVVDEDNSSFLPKTTMTRGDVAVILHRLFKKLW